VFGATVPEAAVNEHGNMQAGEYDVRLSAEPLQRCTIHSKTKSVRVELTSDRDLGRCVPGGLPAHPLAHCIA